MEGPMEGLFVSMRHWYMCKIPFSLIIWFTIAQQNIFHSKKSISKLSKKFLRNDKHFCGVSHFLISETGWGNSTAHTKQQHFGVKSRGWLLSYPWKEWQADQRLGREKTEEDERKWNRRGPHFGARKNRSVCVYPHRPSWYPRVEATAFLWWLERQDVSLAKPQHSGV